MEPEKAVGQGGMAQTGPGQADLSVLVGQTLYALSLSALGCACPQREGCDLYRLAVRLGSLLAQQLKSGALVQPRW